LSCLFDLAEKLPGGLFGGSKDRHLELTKESPEWACEGEWAAGPQNVQGPEEFESMAYLLLLSWENFKHQGVSAGELDHGCVDGVVVAQHRTPIDLCVRGNGERLEHVREFF
jgi:hypothetical protein